MVLCIGVALATISDGDMSTSLTSILVALAAIGFTAIYQVHFSSIAKFFCALTRQSNTCRNEVIPAICYHDSCKQLFDFEDLAYRVWCIAVSF